MCFSRFSSLRVSNGKQILSHWNALENYQIFPILAEKGGWWSLETHSKEKDLLSTKFPQLNLSQLNFSLKLHSHRGRTFISFCEKKKKCSYGLLMICPILWHLGKTSVFLNFQFRKKGLISSRWFFAVEHHVILPIVFLQGSILKDKYKHKFCFLCWVLPFQQST